MSSPQRLTSAATSLRQVPAIFKLGQRNGYWRPMACNVDLGGGAYDLMTDALASVGVLSFVIDPYNRSREHNENAWLKANHFGVDTVTCSNVLNVIDSRGGVAYTIAEAYTLLDKGGVAYFTMYEGDRSGKGRETCKGYQRNEIVPDYLPAIMARFGEVNVTRQGPVIIARKAS